MSTFSVSLQQLEQAIVEEEGGTSSVGYGVNNPGDLELGDQGYGVTTAQGGNQITNFPSLEAGYQALQNMLNKDVSGQSSIYNPNETLADYMTTFTGGNTNAGNTVASQLGVSPSTPISSFGQTPSTQPSTGISSGTLQAWESALGMPAGVVAQTGMAAQAANNSGFTLPSVTDIVAIFAGLVLLAGAVFGFRQLTTTIVEGVKTGATTAEVAA